jgi:hypothetical protein
MRNTYLRSLAHYAVNDNLPGPPTASVLTALTGIRICNLFFTEALEKNGKTQALLNFQCQPHARPQTHHDQARKFTDDSCTIVQTEAQVPPRLTSTSQDRPPFLFEPFFFKAVTEAVFSNWGA